MKTPLCDLLGIDVPVLSAPMGGGVAGARLAAAVSAAGGLGLIGGTTVGGSTWLVEQVLLARAVTSRPVGVGLISHLPSVAVLSSTVVELGVRIVCHSFADPTPFVTPLHDAGALVMCQVRSVAEATAAAGAGADVLIAQGTEAGGHTGEVSTMALVPAVVDAVGNVPVVAAGGIADGRGLAAALMLGAQGVMMGTRFLATPECEGRAATRERVLAATADDTVLTAVFDLASGLPWPPDVRGRSLRNAFTDTWHGREADLRGWTSAQRADFRARAVDDPATGDVYAGQASGLVHEVEAAGDVVRRVAAEAERLLRRGAGRADG